MNRLLLSLLAIIVLFTSCEQIMEKPNSSARPIFKPTKIAVSYPQTQKDATIKDDYHGKVVDDAYRWLEDDHSEDTKSWVKAQNNTTFSYIDKIPYRDAIEERLQKMWNYERFSTPFKEGGKYYYFKNDGLQNQSVLYVQDDLKATPQIALDPNQFSSDGTASLGGYAFSKDGRYLAYEVSEGGSDWRSIRVKDMVEGKVLEDRLDWAKFNNIAWSQDGFYYSRYPQPEDDDVLKAKSEFHQVFYHKLGTPQSEDEIIFADRARPNRGFYANTTDDERFLVISVWESTSGNALYFKDLSDPEAEFLPVVEGFDADFTFVDNIKNSLLLLTNHKAGNNRLIAVNAQRPEESYWKEVIAEGEDKLAGVDLVSGKLVARYTHNASSKVLILDQNGNEEGEIKLPGIGTVGAFSGKKGEKLAFYSFTAFTQPTTIYSIDMDQQLSQVFKKPKIDFDVDAYETKQLWFTSTDGTKVPMFVTHKKGLSLDGKRPTLLYGYGGFDISILPGFNTTRLNLAPIFLENGGVFAVANIRGGGEFGKKWHEAGTKEKKQNVFNDFQAAAEYLIDQKFTSSEKLAIYGRSNGGLLVGACMTQRPDLYKVALPAVGVLDMLRYQEFTIGRAWATDYGLSEESTAFDYLYAYSPLHNIKDVSYPATMVTTADHDDRVVPAHSFKFAAALQEHQQGDNPALIRIETSAGHGGGKPTSKRIEEAADILGFTFYNLGEDVIYKYELAQ